jgi:hypothetical protein
MLNWGDWSWICFANVWCMICVKLGMAFTILFWVEFISSFLCLKYSNCSYKISCWIIFCYFSLYKVITWMQSIKFIKAFKPFFITSKIHDGFNFNEFSYKSFYFPFTFLFVFKSWWWIKTSGTLVSLLMSMFFILIMKLVLHFVCMHKFVWQRS